MSELTSMYVATGVVSKVATDRLIAAAVEAASALGIEVSVAVVDAGGHLKGFSRTDRAPFLTADAAINKAWTAASFGYPTHTWNDYLADPKIAPLGHIPRMLAVGGGHPLLSDGKLIGGVGVSGGSSTQDQEIAEMALKAAGFSA